MLYNSTMEAMDMGKLSETAVENHKRFYTCSGAVLCAFAAEAGMTEGEARQISAPFAGGRMGKCGAVLAVERVLTEKFGAERAEALIFQLEAAFMAKNKSVLCGELRGRRLRPCRGCVQDSAELLESLLAEQG